LANIAVSLAQQKEYDFDIGVVIKDLQMSYRSDDEESSQRKEVMSKDFPIEEIDTFVSMKNDKVIINRCYSKKKNPQDLQDVRVHTKEFKVKKIGWVGRKHAINYNVDEMVRQGIERENTVKELKKYLARKNKLVKEIEVAKMTIEDMKVQTSLNIGVTSTKEALVNAVMRVVNELSLWLVALIDEQNIEENTMTVISQLLQDFQNHE